MDGLNFEWDENKNISNQKKHDGVTFEEAKTVFADELARLKLLLVSHCEVNSETIRIISARKADKSERKQYKGYGHA